MASNKFTAQTPIANQSIRVVLAERAYIAPADTAYAEPAEKLDGDDPASPWLDLGVVDGSKVTLNYTKEIKKIETGIDKVVRGAYLNGKACQAVFTLSQYDVTVLERLTGLTAGDFDGSPVIGHTLHIGQEDVVRMALLFVGTNKVDGKEFHTYNPDSIISFSLKDADDARVMEVTADMLAFTPEGETIDAVYTLHILD